jgi:hypothetical protein
MENSIQYNNLLGLHDCMMIPQANNREICPSSACACHRVFVAKGHKRMSNVVDIDATTWKNLAIFFPQDMVA